MRRVAAEAKEQQEVLEAAQLLRDSLKHLREQHNSLDGFFEALFSTKDRALSFQVTQLIDQHGTKYAHAMHKRLPEVMHGWARDHISDHIASEGRLLAELLAPDLHKKFSSTLTDFRLDTVFEHAKEVAPTLLHMLRIAGTHEGQGSVHRDRDLVGHCHYNM